MLNQGRSESKIKKKGQNMANLPLMVFTRTTRQRNQNLTRQGLDIIFINFSFQGGNNSKFPILAIN